MRVGDLLFFAVIVASTQVRADSTVRYLSDKNLQIELQAQRYFETLNIKFDQRYISVSDVEKRHTWRIGDKTENDKALSRSIQKVLPILYSHQKQKEQISKGLEEALSGSREFLKNWGWDGRLFGMKVHETYPLILGTSVSTRTVSNDGLDNLANGVKEVCFSDFTKSEDAVDTFIGASYANLSCAQRAEEVELLEDGPRALSKKLRLLTGSDLPEETLDHPDPNYQLDFQNAPKLKIILLSYLEFKHDFSGRMIFQAVKHHVLKGTELRILLPGLPIGNFVHRKDAQLLNQLKALGPKVKLIKFTFQERAPDLTTALAVVGRSQHAKLLVVLGQNPYDSAVIVGGRNIKDTFYLRKPPDYSRFPEMVQYGKEAPFGIFRDMEVLIRGHSFAEQVASQMLSFWNFNASGPKMLKASHHIPVGSLPTALKEAFRAATQNVNFVRHVFSVPYLDGQASEKMFVDLINSAKREVRLVTPYLRPPSSIQRAIVQALVRGVRVEILTGFDLSDDNVAPFTEDMNKMTVNDFIKAYSKLKNSGAANFEDLLRIYEWREDSVIHSKILEIDREILFIGSFNFDRRGLTNDTENGVLMVGPVVSRFDEVFEKVYLPQTEVLNAKQKINKAYPLLIKLLDMLDMT